MIRLLHGRVSVELHEVRSQRGPTLLLLHALRGSSDDWDAEPRTWPGTVYALDFAGHGRSKWIGGGSYYAELFAADADVALSHIGPARVVGAGLGAYVALLLAGARPDQVPAALLLPGAGLEGGSPLPDFDATGAAESTFPDEAEVRARADGSNADPRLAIVENDVRPTDYAHAFAATARRLLLMEDGAPRPAWWQAVCQAETAEASPADLGQALVRLASDA